MNYSCMNDLCTNTHRATAPESEWQIISVRRCHYGHRMAGEAGEHSSNTPRTPGLVRRWFERADTIALQHAESPTRALRLLLIITTISMVVGIPIGIAAGDPPLWLREGMPGTLLSAAMLVAAALVAWSVHKRLQPPVHWYQNFWGLSAVVLTVLAVVEIAQPTAYLGHFLEDDEGWDAPGPIQDIDSVLVMTILALVAVVMVPRALVLLKHRNALIFMVVAVGCVVASTASDALFEATDVEFIVEDGIKAYAGPFLVTAYLWALRDIAIKP